MPAADVRPTIVQDLAATMGVSAWLAESGRWRRSGWKVVELCSGRLACSRQKMFQGRCRAGGGDHGRSEGGTRRGGGVW